MLTHSKMWKVETDHCSIPQRTNYYHYSIDKMACHCSIQRIQFFSPRIFSIYFNSMAICTFFHQIEKHNLSFRFFTFYVRVNSTPYSNTIPLMTSNVDKWKSIPQITYRSEWFYIKFSLCCSCKCIKIYATES